MKITDKSLTQSIELKNQFASADSILKDSGDDRGQQITQSEPQVTINNTEDEDLTTAFFAVGAVINIVMVAAYFVWAFKQWKK